ncbi:hypothetical protein PENTCL1PPCAC_16810, partial [Pristionchus entomophagus]
SLLQILVFEVPMKCGGCANAVRKNIDELGDSATIESIDVPTNRIVVRSRKTMEEMKEQLEKTGKTITFVEAR